VTYHDDNRICRTIEALLANAPSSATYAKSHPPSQESAPGGVLLVAFDLFAMATPSQPREKVPYLYPGRGMMLLAEVARKEGLFDWLVQAVRQSNRSLSQTSSMRSARCQGLTIQRLFPMLLQHLEARCVAPYKLIANG
jgi:hypothetical protein